MADDDLMWYVDKTSTTLKYRHLILIIANSIFGAMHIIINIYGLLQLFMLVIPLLFYPLIFLISFYMKSREFKRSYQRETRPWGMSFLILVFNVIYIIFLLLASSLIDLEQYIVLFVIMGGWWVGVSSFEVVAESLAFIHVTRTRDAVSTSTRPSKDDEPR